MLLDHQTAEGAFNASSACPQDFAQDVQPIQDALQASLDAGLLILWNPVARLCRPGSYDVYGHAIPATYEGRWQVGKVGALDGEFTVIHTLGSELGPDRPYRAVGWWLVDFLREWDTKNVETIKKIQATLAANDALDAARQSAQEQQQEEDTHRYAVDRLGMQQWIGRGAHFTSTGV